LLKNTIHVFGVQERNNKKNKTLFNNIMVFKDVIIRKTTHYLITSCVQENLHHLFKSLYIFIW